MHKKHLLSRITPPREEGEDWQPPLREEEREDWQLPPREEGRGEGRLAAATEGRSCSHDRQSLQLEITLKFDHILN